jgi:hypothetical protein
MGHRHLTPRLIVNLLIGDKRTCGVGIKLKGSGLALYLPNEGFHIGRHVKLHSCF